MYFMNSGDGHISYKRFDKGQYFKDYFLVVSDLPKFVMSPPYNLHYTCTYIDTIFLYAFMSVKFLCA